MECIVARNQSSISYGLYSVLKIMKPLINSTCKEWEAACFDSQFKQQ